MHIEPGIVEGGKMALGFFTGASSITYIVKKIIGFGVVVNTSFNKHGRTMVLTPDDAIKDFLDSKMDFIFFEEILVTKK